MGDIKTRFHAYVSFGIPPFDTNPDADADNWMIETPTVCLDGDFTIEDLQAIIEKMEKHALGLMLKEQTNRPHLITKQVEGVKGEENMGDKKNTGLLAAVRRLLEGGASGVSNKPQRAYSNVKFYVAAMWLPLASILVVSFSVLGFGLSSPMVLFIAGSLVLLSHLVVFTNLYEILKFIKQASPFVLKKNVLNRIEQAKREALHEERKRLLFMQYHDLFNNLPPFEYSNYSDMDTGGCALINPHGVPLTIMKFPKNRRVIRGDLVTVKV